MRFVTPIMKWMSCLGVEASIPRRAFTTQSIIAAPRPTFSRPGPPPLPPQDQAEFDALLKVNSSIGASPAMTEASKLSPEEIEHRDIRKGAKAEFAGDVNPKTGEQGGPKSDPFRASQDDWSYAGRVTVS